MQQRGINQLRSVATVRAGYSTGSPTTSRADLSTPGQELASRGLIAFPSDVIALRIRVRNWQAGTAVGGTAYANAITVSGMWLGAPTNFSPPPWQGTFRVPPSLVVPSFSTDAAGAESYSNWITDRSVLPRRGVIYGWSLGLKMPTASTTIAVSGAAGLTLGGGGFSVGKNLSTAAQAGAAHNPNGVPYAGYALNGGWMDVRFEAVMANMPVVAAFGDSIMRGYSNSTDATHSYPHESAFGRAGLANGFAAQSLAIGGQRADLYAADPLSSHRYQRIDWITSPPDAVVLGLGRNDIDSTGSSASAATLEASVMTLMDNIRTLAPRTKIYLLTLMPGQFTGGSTHNTVGSTENVARLAYNAWARSLPYGAHGVIDWDDAMNPPGTPLNGDSSVNGNSLYMAEGDPHPARAGQGVLATRFPSFAR